MKLFTGTTPGITVVAGCLPVGGKMVPVAPALCGAESQGKDGEISLLRADIQDAPAIVPPSESAADDSALVLLRECAYGLSVLNFQPHDLVPSCSRCRVVLFDASAQSYSIAYSPSWYVVSAMDALVVLAPGAWVELHTEESHPLSWVDLLLSLFGRSHASTVKVHRTRWTYDGNSVKREQMPVAERQVAAS